MTKEKTQRVLGGDINTLTKEELIANYDKVMKEITERVYDLPKFSPVQMDYIILNFLPNLEWEGKGVYDIYEMVEMINNLSDVSKDIQDCTTTSKKEPLQVFFHLLLGHKNTGVNSVGTIKKILNDLTTPMQKINEDIQLSKDAGFEFSAAEQGISPEQCMEAVMQAENQQ